MSAYSSNHPASETSQRMLQDIYETVSLDQGETFFEQLLTKMAEVMSQKFAFIGQFLEDGTMETIVCYADGVFIDNFTYNLEHTPCRRVTETQTLCSYTENTASLFPRDKELADWNIESYIGSPLIDNSGETQGILVVMDPQPMEDKETKEIMMGIFARHAAAQLERIHQMQRLRQREQTYRLLLENLPDAMMLVVRNQIQYANPSAESLLQLPDRKIRRLLDYIQTEDLDLARLLHEAETGGVPSSMYSFTLQRRDRSERQVSMKVIPTTLEGREVLQILLRDITAQQESDAYISYLAYHDPLTETPNRQFLYEKAEPLFHQHPEPSSAVLFIDVNRFKKINASFGQATGDALLARIAGRLNQETPDNSIAARWSGAEFIVFLPQADEDAALLTAERILDAFQQPFVVSDLELIVTLSIGISCSPQDGPDLDTLISRADMAMAAGKEEKNHQAVLFHASMDRRSYETLMLENNLQTALKNEEFCLYYQPQFSACGEHVIGVEALLRWEHRELGMISPGDFIPMAEITGLIIPIGEWVLERACLDVQKIHEAGYNKVQVSVNLSVRQFYQHGLVEMIKRTLETTGLNPWYLKLEITESVAADIDTSSTERLFELEALGVRIAIDDFGTGYSSLSYLSSLPVHELKIDRSFIQRMAGVEADAKIVRSTIQLAHELGLRVTAEGIEQQREHHMLRSWGCDEMQGFYFMRPYALSETLHRLSTYHDNKDNPPT
ncbi:sensor domain-containing phosphodiesterase [Alkalicoccus chagannorensis]|uniref:sensor domain-containing phosphodiesterase n=1 Tax=Alkalicoccus chagannorensis TaxID=427072 RepID=UPI000406293F|nr:GGDEF and EAL domain-containing protein [Alkalicoccus chagannorensis]